MTDSESPERMQLLKCDRNGRVISTPAQREAVLDAYEASGLSGPKFAELHGLKYQTFASWRQRRRELCEEASSSAPVEQTNPDSEQMFTLVEATGLASETGPKAARGLQIEFAGGARLNIKDSSGVELAAELLVSMNKR